MHERLSFVLATVALVGFSACSSQPVIVSEPPVHARLPSEGIPWEEQYERAMLKPQVLSDVPADPHKDQDFTGELVDDDEGGIWGVVADTIAFPFRAFGWLLREAF